MDDDVAVITSSPSNCLFTPASDTANNTMPVKHIVMFTLQDDVPEEKVEGTSKRGYAPVVFGHRTNTTDLF
jgi:hypothetical protein